jgi:hypothetical protein
MALVDIDGRPLDTDTEIDPDLPPWCGGVRYRGDDDVCTLTVRIPVQTPLGVQTADVHLEAHTDELRALYAALGRVIDNASRAAAILDVPVAE